MGAHGVAVSHPLRMRKALGSNPSVSNAESLPTSEVKRHRARLVLGWETAWEHLQVLSALLHEALCGGASALRELAPCWGEEHSARRRGFSCGTIVADGHTW